jgi:hypothetical protein
VAGRIRSIGKSSDLISNRTRDLNISLIRKPGRENQLRDLDADGNADENHNSQGSKTQPKS